MSGSCVHVCTLSAGEINSYRDEIETQLAGSSRTKLRGIYASYTREGKSSAVYVYLVHLGLSEYNLLMICS